MRLLFISNFYPPAYIGGYEQLCFDAATALKAGGHDVRVLTSNYLRHEVQLPEAGVYRLLSLKKDWNVPAAAHAKAGALTAFDTLRVQRHNVRVAGRVLRHVRPDAVVIWNGGHLGYGIVAAVEERANAFYILADTWLAPMLALQKRGVDVPARVRIWKRALQLFGIPDARVSQDRLIFCSRSLRDQYTAFGTDVSLGRVIYLGVDSHVFAPRPQHILSRQPGEPFRVLYCGQIVPHKGVSTLIEALALVRAMPGLDNTKLSLLGTFQTDEYRNQLRGRIASLGLEGAVEFLERRPRTQVPEVHAAHDLLAFTSEWEEPFALALLEAMATGLPVVSSLRGGSAEIVEDGVNALAFEAGDPASLAAKLGWGLSHPEEVAAIGRRASKQVLEHYTLRSWVAALEAAIVEGIDGGAARTR